MRLLALILVLLPSLALAGPLVITKDTRVDNTYRWLDGLKKNLGGLRYDGKDLTVERNVIRFYKATDSDTVVRNATFRLKAPTTGSNLPVALEYRAGTNHLVENVVAEGFRMVPIKDKYENGDCFSGEREASNITFRNTTARDCSDGGFDFKSKDVRYENATAEDAGKGWRVWGTATASTITCRHWKERCIQMTWGVEGNPASFTVDKLILDPTPGSGAMTFAVQPKAYLNVKTCRGSLNPVGKVIWYDERATPQNADVTLCGVKVGNQTDAQLRAKIEARIKADTDAETSAATASFAALPKPLCTFPTKLADNDGDGTILLGKVNAPKCGVTVGTGVRLISEGPSAFAYGLAN